MIRAFKWVIHQFPACRMIAKQWSEGSVDGYFSVSEDPEGFAEAERVVEVLNQYDPAVKVV